MLELAVGGAHNDTLVLAFLAGALALTAGTAIASEAGAAPAGATSASRDGARSGTSRGVRASPRYRAGALTLAAGVGVKVTAGVVLPFLVLGAGGDGSSWRKRGRVALAAVIGLALVAAIGLVGFGSHALGFIDAVGEQQQLVAVHSIPAETARLFGLHGTPELVAALLRRRVRDRDGVRAVADRARRGLARGRRLEHAGAADVHRLAAAVVCDLAAAASRGQRRSAPARRHADRLRLRDPDPPLARRPAAQPPKVHVVSHHVHVAALGR